MNRLLLALLLLPSLALAQFDSTLGSTITGARIQHDAPYNASVLDSGAAPASDAEDVQEWSDVSGNGTDATAPAAGNRPVYDIDGFRSAPCVQGRSGDYLTYADHTWSKNLSGFTAVFAFKHVSNAGVQGLLVSYSSGNRIRPYIEGTGDGRPFTNLLNPDATDNSVYPNIYFTDATEHIYIIQANLGSSSLKTWIDNSNTSTHSLSGTSSTTNSDSVEDGIFGSDIYGSGSFLGCMALMLFYNYGMNDTQVGTLYTAVDNYLDGTPPPSGGGSSMMLMGLGQ